MNSWSGLIAGVTITLLLFKHAPAYAHLQSTLDAVQVMPDEENRFNALKAVFSQLMADATLTPLFNYHYRISAPPGVNGVRLTPRGWFEFTEAWLPAPSQ